MSDNLTLVDGDIVVYRVGFASEGTSWSICKSRVDKMLQEILENTDASVMFGYLTSGKDNFRNKVAVTHPYKGNRPQKKPEFYEHIRQYLMETHGFELHSTQEADDAIGIAHAEMGNWSCQGIYIASIDKDLLMIPGNHYNIRTQETSKISIRDAEKNFYRQVLTGDSTDNIKGLAGIGPVKASKIIDSYDRSQYPSMIYKEYAERIHTHKYTSEVGELIWIRREIGQEVFAFTYVEGVYNKYKE